MCNPFFFFLAACAHYHYNEVFTLPFLNTHSYSSELMGAKMGPLRDKREVVTCWAWGRGL